MRSFKDYIELKEELGYKEELEQLNEEPLTIAATALGYAGAGLFIGWAGALIVKGYMSLAQKMIKGIKRAWQHVFGKKMKENPKEIVSELRRDNMTKRANEQIKKDEEKYADKLKDVFDAIKEEDAGRTIEALKEANISLNPTVERLIIVKSVEAFGEPPLHYGNTGNITYKFIKKILGIKSAQAAAIAVKEALKQQSVDLVDNSKDKE